MAILLHDLRRSQRYQARLEAHLFFKLLLIDLNSADAAQSMLFLNGYTRDISETGLSLILPVANIDERFLNPQKSLMRITLQLPDGLVSIEAVSVHHRQLCENLQDVIFNTGYLIGVDITKVSNGDRYIRLLKGIEKEE